MGKTCRTVVLLILLATAISVPSQAPADQPVKVGVTAVAFSILTEHFLDAESVQSGRISRDSCPALQSDRLEGLGLAVAEFAIVCNAVFSATLTDTIQIIHNLPHRRRLTAISTGEIDVSGSTIFPEGIANVAGESQLLLSDPLLQTGEFEKAVFTLPNRSDVLSVGTLEELRRFSAVIVKNWRVDVATLQAMGLKKVASTSKASHYEQMIQVGRADFTISEFSSHLNQSWAKNFVRVPGIKIGLMSTRIFPVAPGREDIVSVLNDAIRKLRAPGSNNLEALLTRAGFFSMETNHWKRLFPTE